MRTTLGVVGILSLSKVVAAQSACVSLTTLFPDCALGCVTSAAAEVGCDATDVACRCIPTNSNKIQETALPCVLDECGLNEEIIGSAIEAGQSVCGCVATAVPEEPEPTPTPTPTETDPGDDDTTTEDTATEDPTSTEPPTTDPPEPTATCDSESPCQDAVDAVPECASSCILSAAETNAKCGTDDYECQCSSTSVIQGAAQGCVLSGCGAVTGIRVLQSVSALCACVTASPTEPCEATATATTDPGNGGGGSSGSSSSEPTDTETTDEPSEPTTCADATTSDCKPVASTAIPTCAQECFISAGPQVGCDDPDDYACRCGEEARSSLTGIIVPCVATACDSALLPSIIAGSEEVCSCALAPPSGGDCSTTGGGGGGGGGGGSSKPTKTKTTDKPSEPTTCAEATTTDCGPVATAAIPECAQPCFSRAAPSIGCDVDEFNCYCQEDARAQLTGLLVPCVATACDSNLLPSIIAGAEEVCACATAPPSGGDCDGGNGGGGGGYPPKPTDAPGGGDGGEGSGPGSSCKPAETSDCAPLTTLVPDCARPCFADAGPEVGCDDPEDLACRCQPDTQASLSQILIPCVATRCDAAQLPSVIAGASSVCACATAAPVGGDDNCPGEGGNGGGAPSPPEPTKAPGGGSGGDSGSSCVPGEPTPNDCLPVASSVVPECAQACFSSAAPNVGCEVNEFGCLCQEEAQASLSAILVPCVASNCAASQLTEVIAGASSVCQCALAAPTGGADTCEPGSGGGGGGSGGGEGGEGSEGGAGEGGGDSGAPPQETGPEVVVPGAGARFEISLVAAVFGSFWLIAVML